jgi:hypothetical protein
MVARNRGPRKRPPCGISYVRLDRVALAGRRRHVFGAPGRAGAAHIMQFRPVGVECPDEEGAPEGFEFGNGLRGAVRGRGGKGCGIDHSHDARPELFVAAFAALITRFVALKTSFGLIY